MPLGLGGGPNNIAIGYRAGASLEFGDNNILIGNPGDANGDENTIRIGEDQMRTFIAGIRGVAMGYADAVSVADRFRRSIRRDEFFALLYTRDQVNGSRQRRDSGA